MKMPAVLWAIRRPDGSFRWKYAGGHFWTYRKVAEQAMDDGDVLVAIHLEYREVYGSHGA